MTMKNKKGRFAEKGKSILKTETADKPKDIAGFLEEDKDNAGETAPPESVHKYTNTQIRKSVFTETRTKEKTKNTVREDFRLPYELAERLRTYAFKNRITKTTAVIRALESYFEKEE